MAFVHEPRYYSGGRVLAWSPQYNCGQRMPLNPTIFNKIQQQDSAVIESTGSGHVCIQTDNSAEEVLQLETRPRSRSSGCLQPELEQPTGEGLCQCLSRLSTEQSTATTGDTGPSGSSIEEPVMVPHSTGRAGGLPFPPPVSSTCF